MYYICYMKGFPILNISQFESSELHSDFYSNIFSIHLEHHHTRIMVPHKHDFYLIVFFTEGTGRHEVDFVEYPIHPGALFFLQPGQTHHWEFDSKPEGFVFFHSKEFYQLSFPMKNIDDYPMFYSVQNSAMVDVRNNPQFDNIKIVFEEIYAEYKSEDLFKWEKIRLLVDLIYIQVTRVIIDKNSHNIHTVSKSENRLRKLEKLIDEHYLKLKRPSDYAEMMHITTKHLNKITMNAVAKSTTDLIQERIILEAKCLLVQNEMNIQELAAYLGFEDPAYFARLFKNKTGVSPRDFATRYVGK